MCQVNIHMFSLQGFTVTVKRYYVLICRVKTTLQGETKAKLPSTALLMTSLFHFFPCCKPECTDGPEPHVDTNNGKGDKGQWQKGQLMRAGSGQITCKYNSNASTCRTRRKGFWLHMVTLIPGALCQWELLEQNVRCECWHHEVNVQVLTTETEISISSHSDYICSLTFHSSGHVDNAFTDYLRLYLCADRIKYLPPIFRTSFKCVPYAPWCLDKTCLFCTSCAQSTRMSIFNLMGAIILRGQPQQRSSLMLPRLVKWESRITSLWCCTDQVVHLVPWLGHHS